MVFPFKFIFDMFFTNKPLNAWHFTCLSGCDANTVKSVAYPSVTMFAMKLACTQFERPADFLRISITVLRKIRIIQMKTQDQHC